MMIPVCSRARTRRRHGEGLSPTRSASSVLASRPSSCSCHRIARSIRSMTSNANGDGVRSEVRNRVPAQQQYPALMDGNQLCRCQKEPVMRIGLVSLYVDDQEKARTFYAEAMGLQVKTDAPYGPQERWLTVVSPEDADGVEVALHLGDEAARAYQKAAKTAGRPALSLISDDAQRDYERLRAKGVEFTMPPTRMDYGGTDAVFDDTCGNLINLHQE